MLAFRNVENPARPLTSSSLAEFLSGPAGAAGVAVTERSALGMAAVWRCVSLISGVAAALPLKTYETGTRRQVPSRLLSNPHPDLTAFELWRWSYVSRCLWGNAYLAKVRDNAGRTTGLYPINPERVKVCKVKRTPANEAGKLFDIELEDGTRDSFTSDDVFHLPGFGYDGVCGVSPVRLAAQGIGLGLAAEEYGARLFGSGSLMSGVLQSEQRLDQEQAQIVKDRWVAKVSGLKRSHEPVVIDSGLSFQSMTMPNTDAQFLESRRFQTQEIGRFFGVPAFLLGDTEKSTSWGTGLEQQAIGWVQFDLHPQWLAPTEQRITKELTGGRVDAKYSVQGLLRGDSTARAAYYRVMREVGALSANDIREFEDQPPIEGGDAYMTALNLGVLGESDDEGTTDESDDSADD